MTDTKNATASDETDTENLEATFTEDERRSDEVGFYDDDVGTSIAPTISEVEIKRQSCMDLWIVKLCLQSVRGDLEVEAFVLGQSIGGGTISRDRPKLCLGNSVGLAKTKLCVRADFDTREAFASGEVCRRKWTGGWTCRAFRTVALKW